ncbi:unnamed protein product [Sphenostylis stenocarpa]|uniref:Uncharacterized protein n=1 Tax=Sphenostylis stenocarpa TaxID=92480 RepID=A0AA86W3S7_9FABA|nr:unnamed protein product [Sphenostylis stenocarpa]
MGYCPNHDALGSKAPNISLLHLFSEHTIICTKKLTLSNAIQDFGTMTPMMTPRFVPSKEIARTHFKHGAVNYNERSPKLLKQITLPIISMLVKLSWSVHYAPQM